MTQYEQAQTEAALTDRYNSSLYKHSVPFEIGPRNLYQYVKNHMSVIAISAVVGIILFQIGEKYHIMPTSEFGYPNIL